MLQNICVTRAEAYNIARGDQSVTVSTLNSHPPNALSDSWHSLRQQKRQWLEKVRIRLGPVQGSPLPLSHSGFVVVYLRGGHDPHGEGPGQGHRGLGFTLAPFGQNRVVPSAGLHLIGDGRTKKKVILCSSRRWIISLS